MNQLYYFLPNKINDLSTLLTLRKVNKKFRDCVDKLFINDDTIKCHKMFLIILLIKHSPQNALSRINIIISSMKNTWGNYFDALILIRRYCLPEEILILLVDKYKYTYVYNYPVLSPNQNLFINICKYQHVTYKILNSYRTVFKYQKIHKQKHLHQYLFDKEIYEHCQHSTKWDKISPPQTYTIHDFLISLISFAIFLLFVFFVYFFTHIF